jgi:non-heme chloroperoxidase
MAAQYPWTMVAAAVLQILFAYRQRRFRTGPVQTPRAFRAGLTRRMSGILTRAFSMTEESKGTTRRTLMSAGLAAATLAVAVPALVGQSGRTQAATAKTNRGANQGSGYLTLRDGARLFYKDWGSGPTIVFHHGWPLSGDDWDNQMLFFLSRGYRVIAHDRRGHGRSSQTAEGNDMDTYAADVAELMAHLGVKNAVHVGHSTGGGEVVRYVARHGIGRVAKAVLIGAVPPLMLRTQKNPGGLPLKLFDSFREALATDRAGFYREVAEGPFYGFNRPGARISQAVVDNCWRQGMSGGAKAHYDLRLDAPEHCRSEFRMWRAAATFRRSD